MGYSGTWGKLIHEKSSSRTSRGTVPLSTLFNKEQIKKKIVVQSRVSETVYQLENLCSSKNRQMPKKYYSLPQGQNMRGKLVLMDRVRKGAGALKGSRVWNNY
jgi:hypothetical protein